MLYKNSLHHIDRNLHKKIKFDYNTLSSEQRASIQKLTTEIKEDLHKTVRIVWDIGEKLAEVRSQIETCHFTSWLKTEFNWSRRTAYKFISVYEAFPEFSRAQYARLDNVSVSAIYLLAAPSTDPQIRSHFIDLALAGNNISHKSVKAAIDEFNQTQAADPTLIANSSILAIDRSKDFMQIVESMPLTQEDRILELAPEEATVKNSDFEDIELELDTEESAEISDLRPAWNSIEPRFSLFWGNTNSPRFINCLPEDAFVLAVPFAKWHQDWLLNQSRSCLNLTQSKLDKKLVTTILSALAASEKSIVFPWLPNNWRVVELAVKLNLKVYAGDPELSKCEETIAKLGFKSAHH